MWGYTKVETKPISPEDWPVPKKCVFCNIPIEEEDFYNLGYTQHHIFAETCDNFCCKKWLFASVRLRKRTIK